MPLAGYLTARNDPAYTGTGTSRYSDERLPSRLARTIHACRREAFETEVPRGFSHVRPTQAYLQSVEEAEREQPRRREDRTKQQVFMNSPG